LVKEPEAATEDESLVVSNRRAFEV
jgi:hypothetical protein